MSHYQQNPFCGLFRVLVLSDPKSPKKKKALELSDVIEIQINETVTCIVHVSVRHHGRSKVMRSYQ